jgi:hypothetical protein
MTRSLYPHQKEVVHFLTNHQGALALHSTGAGKTLTSIASAQNLMKLNIVSHAFALVNKSIISQFKKEVQQTDPTILDKFEIMTPHTFVKDYDKLKHKLKHSILIIDEAHHFTNVKGKMTKTLLKASKLVKRILLLTGTLYTNSLYDVVPIISMIKQVNPMSHKDFENNLGKQGFFKQYLSDCISVYLIDKNKDPNYPQVKIHEVKLNMNRETQKLIKKDKDLPFLMGDRKYILGAATQHNVEDNQDLMMYCEKCNWLLKHIPKWIEKGEKTILYASFIDAGVRIIQKMINRMGVNCVVIDGEISSKQRNRVMEVFNRPLPPQPKVYINRLKNQKDDSNNKNDEDDEDDDDDDDDDDEDENNNDEDNNNKKPKIFRRGQVNIHNVCGENNALFFRESKENPSNSKKDKPTFTYTYKRLTGKKFTPTKEELHLTQHPPIPPRWTPSVVCKNREKLAWVARDKKDRWQRRYSSEYVLLREKKKIKRLLKMDQPFWNRIDTQIKKDLKEPSNSPHYLHAMAVLLMKYAKFRIGGGPSEHTGVVTIQKKHCKVLSNGNIYIEFIGKSAKTNKYTLSVKDYHFTDKLKKLIRSCDKSTDYIFQGIKAESLRTYCKNLHIRPKDFRTYYANVTLINYLVNQAKPDLLQKQNKTKRIVADAFKEISQGLNNTPGVSKSSYVFSALWMCFSTYPMTFINHIKSSGSESTADQLSYLLRVLDWEKIVKDYNNKDTHTLFEGDVPVLIITNAGSESLDLKGVRHVVFLDSVWTYAAENQIIGRAQRTKSHADLPPDQRVVNVWKLRLKNREHGGESRMKELVDVKRDQSKKLYEMLKDVSIGAKKSPH